MKLTSLLHRSALLIVATTLLGAVPSQARQGATDPIPGTSNGATNSGGGGSGGGKNGGSSSAPAPTPTPAPAPQPIVSAALSFAAAGEINGVLPVCTGSYHIDPYYPTLSLMTVDVQTSSMNVPDGTALYVTAVGSGGTLYPFTSNVVLIAGQTGSCSHSVYVTPGTVIAGVLISDSLGNVVFAGN
jgi:hypothetical protein